MYDNIYSYPSRVSPLRNSECLAWYQARVFFLPPSSIHSRQPTAAAGRRAAAAAAMAGPPPPPSPTYFHCFPPLPTYTWAQVPAQKDSVAGGRAPSVRTPGPVGVSIDDELGALQYLTFTRPDITYAVQQICLHMHDPREPHLAALKRRLRYLHGTIDYGLLLHRSSPPSLSSTLTPTGPSVRTLGVPPPATLSFWAGTWCPGRPSASRWSPTPVPRRSTALSLTAWLRPPGSDSSLPSSTALSPGARWSIVSL